MRLGYDVQACQTDSRDRGIGRYSENLVTSIVKLAASEGIESTIALDGTDVDRLRDARNGLRRKGIEAPTAIYTYPSSELTDLEPGRARAAAILRGRFFESLNLDALLLTSYFETGANYTTGLPWDRFRIPCAAIAYDVIPLIYPDRYLPKGHFISTWYPEKCREFSRFDRLLAISQATRDDLVQYLGVSPERICVIGAGLDPGFLAAARGDAWIHADLLVTHNIREPFVLVVSNGDWRKNTLGALQAFARLSKAVRDSHLLVLTQVGEDAKQALAGPLRGIASRVRVLGKVDDKTLATLYRYCAVFFFPSLYEGFGLPVLEAMAFGAPVISSNQGALAEVIRNEAALFDPRNADATVEILRRSVEDRAFRESLKSGAAEHAQSFTWERCARRTLEALVDLGHGGSSRRTEVASGWLDTDESDVQGLADFLAEPNSTEDDVVRLRQGLVAAASRGVRRILVDITEVVRLDARSGIQRVVRNICKGMWHEAMGRCEVQPICWTESGIIYANQYAREQLGLPVDGVDSPVEVRVNDLLLMLDSSWWLPERFDTLFEAVRQLGGEVVWMVYDLIPVLYPETCDVGMSETFGNWLCRVISSSDGFLCISEATRDDLERFIDRSSGIDHRPWTKSIVLGSDLESGVTGSPSTAVLALAQSLEAVRYFIAVGTIEPRKDHPTILAAFEQLWARNTECALIIVGKQGWSVEAFAAKLRSHPQYGKRLFWMENLSDADLAALMAGAVALVQASLAEGLGLPIIEAAAKGIPVVVSDIPIFREVGGGGASYFEAGNPSSLGTVLEKGLAEGLVGPAAGEIRLLSWRQAADRLLDVLVGHRNGTAGVVG